MGAKIRYLWCEAICAYLHSDLTNMERTFSMEQYEIDVRDSEIIDEYLTVELFRKDKSSLMCVFFHLL